MNRYPCALAILAALAALAASASAQAQTTAPDPFSRSVLTPDEIEALATRPRVSSASPAAVGKNNDQIAQPFQAPKAPPAPASPRPANAPPAQLAAPAPARPRYVQAPVANDNGIAYHTHKGEAKAAYYAAQYNSPPPSLPSAAGALPLATPLPALVERLREQGLDEGKISVELNRLTPAEFVRWADSVIR